MGLILREEEVNAIMDGLNLLSKGDTIIAKEAEHLMEVLRNNKDCTKWYVFEEDAKIEVKYP